MPFARQVLAAASVAAAIFASSSPTSALPSECSACEVVAATLAARIAAEDGRTVLDMRGRLGPRAGQRKGKRIDWKSSETRLASLLEGICDREALDSEYAYRKKRAKREKTVGLSVVPKDDEEDDDDEDDDDEQEDRREVRWFRKGAVDDAELERGGFARVTETAEREYRQKQLEGWCGRLISEVEDDGGLARELSRAGSGGDGGGDEEGGGGGSGGGGGGGGEFDARAALCERLSRSCAPSAKKETTPTTKKEEEKQKRWGVGKKKKNKKQQRDEL